MQTVNALGDMEDSIIENMCMVLKSKMVEIRSNA